LAKRPASASQVYLEFFKEDEEYFASLKFEDAPDSIKYFDVDGMDGRRVPMRGL
jgi:hypothetical protein